MTVSYTQSPIYINLRWIILIVLHYGNLNKIIIYHNFYINKVKYLFIMAYHYLMVELCDCSLSLSIYILTIYVYNNQLLYNLFRLANLLFVYGEIDSIAAYLCEFTRRKSNVFVILKRHCIYFNIKRASFKTQLIRNLKNFYYFF